MKEKPEILKIGVVADDWKETIFRKHLDRAGFKYEFFAHPKSIEGTVTFTVETDDPESLHGVVRTCQAEAAKKGKP